MQTTNATERSRILRWERFWWVALGVVFIVGMFSLVKGYFLEGMSSTNLTSTVPWGAWVAFYIYFIGMSAGSFLLSTLIFAFGMHQYEEIGRSALLSAIASMLTGMTFIFLDIGRPDHVLNSLIHWNITSTMAWEIHFYILYLLLLVTELYYSMRTDLVKRAEGDGRLAKVSKLLTFGYTDLSEASLAWDKRTLKILGSIGIPLAIFGVHGGTGSIFAVDKARPFLNSGLFPVIFVLSALVSGTALSIALYVIKNWVFKRSHDQGMIRSLGALMGMFLAIELGLEWYEFLIGLYGLKAEEILTIKTMTASPWWWTFWIFQMALAMVIPLVIVFYKKTRQSVRWIFAAALMTIVGIVGVRFNMVVPPFVVPVLDGLPPGNYYPTLSEWVTSFGLIAMGLIIYTLGEKLLPIDQYSVGAENDLDDYSMERGARIHD
ncbi:NrfD/PsrC family molybdoenzyme membrane anchor subunit [Desulfosporosinus metallidurans]|uniref:Molybdopterin oxidoreductase n=1 Tax=Desulfosporosinus metallidurans TaxID=1888891 RepID=A0A1Q8QQG6_9FIRM|nr:NrfD/PsrC family molybdoenzyme membrane anchor subunit [Desulfosporosinus metallidurans]OLN29488.1 Molybdopterin oxidoreductase [Desulfosporosinus metallidurans]